MTPKSAIQPWAGGPHLDARRCAFLPESRTLVVADLHLGYAWSRRKRGALLPLEVPDDTLERLSLLQRDYQPLRWVVLGDIVHEALELPAMRQVLCGVCERLAASAELVFCLGNHDRNLEALVQGWKLPATCLPGLESDGLLLTHGDSVPDSGGFELDSEVASKKWIIGHEHPALSLGDGVATQVKCPAFLVSESGLVLPAFSSWAAGCEWGRQPFLGPFACAARFQTAWLCAGSRLLPVPLERPGRRI